MAGKVCSPRPPGESYLAFYQTCGAIDRFSPWPPARNPIAISLLHRYLRFQYHTTVHQPDVQSYALFPSTKVAGSGGINRKAEGNPMYRIELKLGEETALRTIEELAIGIRNGVITPRARI